MSHNAGQRDRNPTELRRKAEEAARKKKGRGSESLAAQSFLQSSVMAHELEVQQIELQMQCEELQRAHLEADALRACYFDFYNLAPVGYCIVRRTAATVVEANLTAATLLGVPRSELVNSSFSRFVFEEDRATYFVHCNRLFERGERHTCELRLLREHGAPFWAMLQASPISHESGSSSACRVVITDISEQKQIEMEEARLQNELFQAQKMNAIGTLAGGVAHDFNNILGGVLSGLDLLGLKLGNASECDADIQDMKALVKRGAHLAEQLLGFSRRGKYDARPLDLASLVEKTSAMFGRAHRNIEIQHEFSPGPHAILMDPTQMEQVLRNLFVNAGQAMPKGGKLLLRIDNAFLSSEETETHGASPGPFVRLVITDNGIGMDAATQMRIFEPFFTTKAQGHGTGLGLASAYGIIKNHGGMIRVESELGKGTVFTILLPETDGPPLEDAPSVAAPPVGTGVVLVVDDEELLLKLVARLLRAMGYEVLTASRGKEALHLVRDHKDRLSLVILDLTMPEMSGARTFEALREIAPRLKVLLCSGYTEEGQAEELLARGCSGFIHKPFDAATLSRKVQSIL